MTGGLNPASADPVSPALKLDQDSMMSNISVDYVAKEDDQPASKFQVKLNIINLRVCGTFVVPTIRHLWFKSQPVPIHCFKQKKLTKLTNNQLL